MNNFDFDEIWLDLDSELAKASELIASEARLENQTEVDDAISQLRLETSWLDRLSIASTNDIYAGNVWVKGSIQHVCDQAIVVVGSAAITIVAPRAVLMIRDLDVKVQHRTHSNNRCWHSVLTQVHDVQVHIDNQLLSGTISSLFNDAFDLETESGRLTIPWNRITSVSVVL